MADNGKRMGLLAGMVKAPPPPSGDGEAEAPAEAETQGASETSTPTEGNTGAMAPGEEP